METDSEASELDPFAFLGGDWEYERQIEDRLAGQTGQARGTASFEPHGQGLRWTEEGQLELNGRRLPASRRMSIEPDGEGWMVFFEDGRPFHRLELSRRATEVGHPCSDDFYDGRYLVTDGDCGPEFMTEWRVSGPEKDQRIITRYRRPRPPGW